MRCRYDPGPMPRYDILASLIASGKLPVGTRVHHVSLQHPERSGEAKIVPTGLRLRGEVYKTPSAAARAINGGNPVQGWLFWKLPDGRPLNTLRGE